MITLIVLVDRFATHRALGFFKVFGEGSLFTYTFHALVIGFVFGIWPELSSKQYLLFYLTLLTILGFFALNLRSVRRKFPNMPTPLKWMIGS